MLVKRRDEQKKAILMLSVSGLPVTLMQASKNISGVKGYATGFCLEIEFS
jgi:hypothetical protein